LAVVWVVLVALTVVLLKRTDPAELGARSEEGEQWMEAWGRAMVGFSGALNPPSRSARKRRSGDQA